MSWDNSKIFNSSVFVECLELEQLDFPLLHTKIKNFSMTLTPSLKKLINEYAILAFLPELNLEQEEKLGEILDQANQNQILGFWIAEVDYILGESLGLLKSENLNSYEDQKAVLREHFSSYLTYLDLDEFGSEKLEIQEKIS